MAGISKPTFFAYFNSKEQILYDFDPQDVVLEAEPSGNHYRG